MDIIQKFVDLHIHYIEIILELAVSGACFVDTELSQNTPLNKNLKQTTLGLCIIYHMVFIQSSLGEQFNIQKRTDSTERSNFDIE